MKLASNYLMSLYENITTSVNNCKISFVMYDICCFNGGCHGYKCVAKNDLHRSYFLHPRHNLPTAPAP